MDSRMAKRTKTSMENEKTYEEHVPDPEEETGLKNTNSEQMELDISQILEKIENFTQMVSELLESGKSMLKELGNDFEERMILIHKEQMEKWQHEIMELRSLDAENEEIEALLHNAKCLLQNIHGGSLH